MSSKGAPRNPNRLHPLSAVSLALRRGFLGFSIPFPLAGIGATVVDVDVDVAVDVIFVLSPIGLVLGVGYGLAYYYRFAYAITPDTLDVTSGVLSQRSREIPYRRIQNVDVTQSVVQRLLGLAVVSIETAGGGTTEATLNFVDADEADRIRSEIRRRGSTAIEASDGESSSTEASDRTSDERDGPGGPASARATGSPTLLFELEAGELLLYAVTAFRWGAVAFPLLLLTWTNQGDFGSVLLPPFVVELARPLGGPESVDGAAVDALIVLAAVAAVQWLLATYLASALYTVANYYGFRLGRQGSDLVYERGLIQRYGGSIPTDKIQSVTVTDNPLQRLVGYAGLRVETAGYGPESGGDQSAIPLADESRVYRFAETLTGVDRPAFQRPPALARRRYLARYALLAGSVVVAAFVLTRFTTLERWYLAAIVFAAVPPAAHLKYVHLGYFLGDDHLVVRRGFWRRRTTVIPYYRVQTVSTRRSLFQRRLGLASVVVDTASSRTFNRGTPVVYDLELETARDIHRTGREHLQRSLRERAGDRLGRSLDAA